MRTAKLVFCLALAACAVIGAPSARAQAGYPDKPVKLVVPASPGGTTDVLARAIGQKLAALWKQPVIVDNKPGANQIIGADAVAKSPADGYTLLVSDSSTFVINQHLYKKLPYDPIKDFTPVATIGSASPVIAVSENVKAKNMQEFIALAKSNPKEVSYGSMGTGSYAHVSTEQLKRMAGIEMQHVPYKGAAPAVSDLVAGNISMMMVNVANLTQFEKNGKVRFIAAATPKRLAAWPQLPTVAESGVPGFEATTWFGVVAPARTDPAIVAKLYADMSAVMTAPDFKAEVLDVNGIEPMNLRPPQFTELIRKDAAHWKTLVEASGASLD